MKKIITAASLLLASLSIHAAPTVPKYDIAAGKAIAESVCGACHGVDGVSTVPAQPNLAGQNVKYLYKQLTDFKAGHRKNAIMSAQASFRDHRVKPELSKLKTGEKRRNCHRSGQTLPKGL